VTASEDQLLETKLRQIQIRNQHYVLWSEIDWSLEWVAKASRSFFISNMNIFVEYSLQTIKSLQWYMQGKLDYLLVFSMGLTYEPLKIFVTWWPL